MYSVFKLKYFSNTLNKVDSCTQPIHSVTHLHNVLQSITIIPLHLLLGGYSHISTAITSSDIFRPTPSTQKVHCTNVCTSCVLLLKVHFSTTHTTFITKLISLKAGFHQQDLFLDFSKFSHWNIFEKCMMDITNFCTVCMLQKILITVSNSLSQR